MSGISRICWLHRGSCEGISWGFTNLSYVKQVSKTSCIIFFYLTNCAYDFQTGPVPAITEVLKKAGLTLKDMDLVEVRSLYRSSGFTPDPFSRKIPLIPCRCSCLSGACLTSVSPVSAAQPLQKSQARGNWKWCDRIPQSKNILMWHDVLLRWLDCSCFELAVLVSRVFFCQGSRLFVGTLPQNILYLFFIKYTSYLLSIWI